MADKSIKAYTLHCAKCLKILGMSPKNFQDQPMFCLKCGKEAIIDMDFDREEGNKPWKVEIE